MCVTECVCMFVCVCWLSGHLVCMGDLQVLLLLLLLSWCQSAEGLP
jgi:hypothetical protein